MSAEPAPANGDREQSPLVASPGSRRSSLTRATAHSRQSGASSGQVGGDRPLLRRASTVSAFTTLGVAAGFLLDVLLVARFGIGAQSDAFFGGYTIPLILVTTTMAISPVFVTILAGLRDDGTAFGVLLNAAGLVSLAVAVLGALLARPLIEITTPGFSPSTAAQAAALARILFARVPVATLAEVCKAKLYAERRFGLASSSNVLPNLITILLLVLPGAGSGIHVVALGLVAGTLAQAALLMGVLFGALRVPYRWTLRHPTPLLSQTGRLLVAPLAGLLLRQGVTLAERFFGSHLAAGSVTALSYANRLTMTVGGVTLDGIATAGLPSLAERWKEGPSARARDELASLMRLMVSVALPVGLLMAALSTPAVLLFFERGQVDHQSALLMGAVLSAYALSLAPLGPFRAAQTYFYAVQDSRPIVVLHGSLTALTVLLDLLLVQLLGAVGLALSFTLSSGIIAVLSILWLARMAGSAGWRRLLDSSWRLGLACLAMAAAAYGASRWLQGLTADSGRWGLILSLSLSSMAGLALLVVTAGLLRQQELVTLRSMVTRRWAQRTRKGS
jgi:putative peptidoglycan lipid II flippase